MGCTCSKSDLSTAVTNPLAQADPATAVAAPPEGNPAATAEAPPTPSEQLAAVKAAAPPEVRLVLDDFMSIYGTPEHKPVARVVTEWLVTAHAAAHGDAATKRLARLVLGVHLFATNMKWAGVWEKYKSALQRLLAALGAPLGLAFVREELHAKLGGLALPPHALVAADQERCAAAGVAHALCLDIDGVFPRRADLDNLGAAERQHHERVFIHMLVLTATALNEGFHRMMREVLRPYVVDGEGVMAKNQDGSWRKTPVKGIARMEWCVLRRAPPLRTRRLLFSPCSLPLFSPCTVLPPAPPSPPPPPPPPAAPPRPPPPSLPPLPSSPASAVNVLPIMPPSAAAAPRATSTSCVSLGCVRRRSSCRRRCRTWASASAVAAASRTISPSRMRASCSTCRRCW
jgi:hypothetical protein